MASLGDSSYSLHLTKIPVSIVCQCFGIRDAYILPGAMLIPAAVFYLALDSHSRGHVRDKRLTGKPQASP
jgi:hypothetical protein